jgi:hypothetical protein
MADNKNQHFVPRAHLKPFSVDGEGAAIHLFNLVRQKAISNAPVKNQCSKDYFYGQDKNLKAAIQFVEGSYAECVSSLIASNSGVSEFHCMILKRFAYLQYLRTEAAARRISQFTFAMTEGSGIEQPSFKEAVAQAVMVAMRQYADTMRIVDDLKVRIIRNHTCRPFITSDDPAVLANRWHQRDFRARHQSFGIASAGIVFFLPLTPTLLAIIFDGSVYSTRHSGGWIDVNCAEDIEACNHQQILNCAANLYFGKESDGLYVASAASEMMHLRPAQRFKIYRAVRDGGTATHVRYKVVHDSDLREHDEVLTHQMAIHAVPPKWPRFLRFRVGGSSSAMILGLDFVVARQRCQSYLAAHRGESSKPN